MSAPLNQTKKKRVEPEFEIANRKVWVMASPAILAELRNGWSRPVQAHAEENADGSWEMTFRTYSERADREHSRD